MGSRETSKRASLLASHYKATCGPMAADLVIPNRGQDTKMTPEMALSSPNFHTMPMRGLHLHHLLCTSPVLKEHTRDSTMLATI
ncbi:hypothetical protein TNCV_569291 [Trichonephila clavipes]|nr:hypothetical protein TNCV_569291 [Trichonephila clavipes]